MVLVFREFGRARGPVGIAERLGLPRVESLQTYYTVAGRDLEREIIPMLRREGVGLLVWSPLAGGLLSGKFGREEKGETGSRRATFDFPPVDHERALRVHRCDPSRLKGICMTLLFRNTSDGFWLNHLDPADGAPSD